MKACPTRCWLVVSRSDCFCPEKSSGKLHLSERDADRERAELDEMLGGAVSHSVVACMIMPDETFYELCPDWREHDEAEGSDSKPDSTLLPSECKAGRWYQHERWGRVLCCGTGNPEEWLPSFAIRTGNGRTELRFLSENTGLLSECEQSW